MPFADYACVQSTSAGKMVFTGNFFVEGVNGKYRTHTQTVLIPGMETKVKYLVYIFPTMLSAVGGPFNQDDTVYVDIYAIDGNRMDKSNGYGGAWGRHFGLYSDTRNMAISAWVGYIQSNITFRVNVTGDDWVGASYIIMEI
jgi:hypothetical protein